MDLVGFEGAPVYDSEVGEHKSFSVWVYGYLLYNLEPFTYIMIQLYIHTLYACIYACSLHED